MESGGRFGRGALEVLDFLCAEFVAKKKGTKAFFYALYGPQMALAFWRGTAAKLARWYIDDGTRRSTNPRAAMYASEVDAISDQMGAEVFRFHKDLYAQGTSPAG